jgi:putative cell wall-binding protein
LLGRRKSGRLYGTQAASSTFSPVGIEQKQPIKQQGRVNLMRKTDTLASPGLRNKQRCKTLLVLVLSIVLSSTGLSLPATAFAAEVDATSDGTDIQTSSETVTPADDQPEELKAAPIDKYEFMVGERVNNCQMDGYVYLRDYLKKYFTGGVGSLKFSAEGLPDGMTIANDGSISGAPAQICEGTAKITVTDGIGQSVTADFPYAVTENGQLHWIVGGYAFQGILYVGDPLELKEVQRHLRGGTLPLTFKSTDLPTGMKIDPETGLVYGACLFASPETKYTITINDAKGDQITGSFFFPPIWPRYRGNDNEPTFADVDKEKPYFEYLELDGQQVDRKNYGVTDGSEPKSTRVTFDTSYMKSLPNGSYDFFAVFSDGSKYPITLIVEVAKAAPIADRFKRHAGAARVETAALAVEHAISTDEGVTTVVIATSSNYPDALAASSLCGIAIAPLLLTDPTNFNKEAAAQLNRLKPSKVYLLGGTAAISKKVEDTIKKYSYIKTLTRLDGNDRYITAKKVADEAVKLGAKTDECYLATGSGFADALSVASFATAQKVPVLLSPTEALSKEAASFITAQKVKTVYVIGGTKALSNKVQSAVNATGAKTTRLNGADRYLTSAQVVKTLSARYNMEPKLIGIASGSNFPDALAGGATIGLRGGILVLTDPKKLSATPTQLLKYYKFLAPNVEVFGGTAAITKSVEDEIKKLM